MFTVAAIGERVRVAGFALVGVQVQVAETATEVRAAWDALAPEVGVVLLTPAAAAALPAGRPMVAPAGRPMVAPAGRRMVAVLP